MKRIKWIDIGKGYAILLVMLGHITQYYGEMDCLTKWIYSFHIPLFFVLAGWLFACKEEWNFPVTVFLRKKMNRLLVPYILFSMINFAVRLGGKLATGQVNGEYVTGQLQEIITFYGNGTVWFCACLFWGEIGCFLHKRYFKGKKSNVWLFFLVLSIVLVTLVFRSGQSDTYWEIVLLRVLLGTLFLEVGMFLFENRNRLHSKWRFPAGCCMFLVNVGLSQFLPRVDLYTGNIGNLLLYLVMSVFGAGAWIMIFKYAEQRWENRKWMKGMVWAGVNSIILMLTSTKVMQVLQLLLNIPNHYLNVCVIFTAEILLEIPVVYIMKHYFWWMIGGRKQAQ